MLPQVQEKVIGALLKMPQNSYCSDCNSKSPCWVSLDFGVFVCMNCSGAHRSLGPSTTRVRSTKLDTWHQDWIQNMKIGNSILNKYWQHQLPSMSLNIKPDVNSSLGQIKKYVYDKYVKRRYVDPRQLFDPLAKIKMGVSLMGGQQQQQLPRKQHDQSKHLNHAVKQTTLTANKDEPFKKLKVASAKKNNEDLLSFSGVKENPVGTNQPKKQTKQFDFNFNQFITNSHSIQPTFQKNLYSTLQPTSNTHKQISFQNFIQNITNKSQLPSNKLNNYQQHHQQKGKHYSNTQQNSITTVPTSKFDAQNFWTGNIFSSPQRNYQSNGYVSAVNNKAMNIPQNGVTLEVTIRVKQSQYKNDKASWVDDWM